MLNRYIIERNMNGVGAGSDQDFAQMAEKSNNLCETPKMDFWRILKKWFGS